MIRPNCWKLHHYIESMLWWCECAESKNKVFYYFPITKEDILKDIELVKYYYEKGIPSIKLLSKLEDKKKGIVNE